MTVVENEVAFGLENLGTPPAQIWPRVERALESVGARHLRGRKTAELSGGELQRVCLASALALEPELLLLDEPTSQLDPDAAELFLDAVARLGATVVLSEHRVGRALALATRVLFVEGGRLLLDAPVAEALDWLAENRPVYTSESACVVSTQTSATPADELLRLRDVSFAYRGSPPVLAGGRSRASAGARSSCLAGPNGSGKTTLAKLAAGLLEPDAGTVERRGRVFYLSQDPGRYLVRETALDEVSLAVAGDSTRARTALERVGLSWAAGRHPRDLSSGERERLALAAVEVGRARSARARRADARNRPGAQAASSGAGSSSYAAAGRAVLVATHDTGLPAHRRIELSVETTQAPVGAKRTPLAV